MSIRRNPDFGQVELALADLDDLQELLETWQGAPALVHDLQAAGLLAADAGVLAAGDEPVPSDELITLLAPMTAPKFWLDVTFADPTRRATHRIWASAATCTVLAEDATSADGTYELSQHPTTNVAGVVADLIGLSAHKLPAVGPYAIHSNPVGDQTPVPLNADTFDPLISDEPSNRAAAAAAIAGQLTSHSRLRDALTGGRWRTWQVACSRPLIDGSVAQAGLTVLDTEHGALRVEDDHLVATPSTDLWLDLLTILPTEAALLDPLSNGATS